MPSAEAKARKMGSGKKVVDPDRCTGCGKPDDDLAFVFSGKHKMPLRCGACRRG